MEPIEVRATIPGPVCLPNHPVALDALLAAAVCVRDGIAPALTAREMVPIPIPVARSECGRYYLASCASYEIEARDRAWTNRRPVVSELQALSPSTRRIQITAGANKGYRIPREHIYLVGSAMTWWCIGDGAEIGALLEHVRSIGKKRSVGLGAVTEWSVRQCEPWGDDFPVARDGAPLRNLPSDYPGLSEPDLAYTCLQPPYWLHERSELCAVPTAPR